MSEEVKQMTIQLKEILNKYPNKQIEILTYVFGKDNLTKIINHPTYDELQQENQQLKLDYELYKDNHIYKNYEVETKNNTIKQLEEVIEEVREYINRVEFTDYIPNTKNYMRLMKIKCDLLQILDKVGGEKNG